MSATSPTHEPTAAGNAPHATLERVTHEGRPQGRPSLASRVWLLIKAAVVAAALVHPVARLFSRVSWLADLVCHFQEPAVGASVLAALVILRGHRRIALGLVGLALFQLIPVLRYSGSNPVAPDAASSARLRLMMINVLYENHDYAAVERLIREEQPDVIGLVEYTDAWGRGLSGIRDHYPYGVEHANGRPSGIALWFRKPPLSLDPPTWPVERRNPYLHGTIEFAGKVRHIWVVHPTSPLLRRVWQAGNPEIEAIAAKVGSVDGSRIVMGDMNSTDGSAHFRDFLDITGLRDSRLGFGRQGSWPNDRPYRIAIDHLFVSNDLAVVRRRLGPYVGSDHFPLIAELAPADAKASTQSAHASTAD